MNCRLRSRSAAWRHLITLSPLKMNEADEDIIEICELKLAAPSFRTRSRLVAKLTPAFWSGDDSGKYCVQFLLQYQHDGEPDHWLDEATFPWHSANLDSIVRAIAHHHDKIEALL